MKRMQKIPREVSTYMDIWFMTEMALASPHYYHTQKVGSNTNSPPFPESCAYQEQHMARDLSLAKRESFGKSQECIDAFLGFWGFHYGLLLYDWLH